MKRILKREEEKIELQNEMGVDGAELKFEKKWQDKYLRILKECHQMMNCLHMIR